MLRRRPGYLLQLDPEQLDLHRFERLTREGSRALPAAPDSAAAALSDALELWRGLPLAEFTEEPFARNETPRLEELRLNALSARIRADLALGRHAQLVGELEDLTAQHPLHEGLRGQLILSLYRSGRQAEALEAYRRARGGLRRRAGHRPRPGTAGTRGRRAGPRPPPGLGAAADRRSRAANPLGNSTAAAVAGPVLRGSSLPRRCGTCRPATRISPVAPAR